MNVTIQDFVSFVQVQMGVPASALPADPATDENVLFAFEFARDSTSGWLRVHRLVYKTALLNLAGAILLDTMPDQQCSTFFADVRKDFNLNGFVGGVVSSTADESTASSLVVPDAFKGLQFGDLQLMKTPYGRAYLAIAQRIGSVWGCN